MRTFTPAALLALGACSVGPRTSVLPPLETTREVVQISTRRGTTELELVNERRTRPYPVVSGAEATLAALPGVYQALSIEGAGVLNPRERLFGRESLRLYRRLGDRQLSRVVNCGSSISGDADSYEVALTVMTTVTPVEGAGSVLRSWVEGQGRPAGMSSTPVRCVSTGLLEREIARLVGEAAAPAAPGS
jgi:hypothetical protein